MHASLIANGDTTPITYAARSISILEAICGVLFIGALVARIAGSFMPPGTDGTETGGRQKGAE